MDAAHRCYVCSYLGGGGAGGVGHCSAKEERVAVSDHFEGVHVVLVQVVNLKRK